MRTRVAPGAEGFSKFRSGCGSGFRSICIDCPNRCADRAASLKAIASSASLNFVRSSWLSIGISAFRKYPRQPHRKGMEGPRMWLSVRLAVGGRRTCRVNYARQTYECCSNALCLSSTRAVMSTLFRCGEQMQLAHISNPAALAIRQNLTSSPRRIFRPSSPSFVN